MSVGAVAVITGVIYGLRELVPVVSTGVVYLLAVLLVSTGWGLWLGLVAAVLSAAAFNFFHIPPTGGFTIADGENWVALVVFRVAAAVVSALTAAARTRARRPNGAAAKRISWPSWRASCWAARSSTSGSEQRTIFRPVTTARALTLGRFRRSIRQQARFRCRVLSAFFRVVATAREAPPSPLPRTIGTRHRPDCPHARHARRSERRGRAARDTSDSSGASAWPNRWGRPHLWETERGVP